MNEVDLRRSRVHWPRLGAHNMRASVLQVNTATPCIDVHEMPCVFRKPPIQRSSRTPKIVVLAGHLHFLGTGWTVWVWKKPLERVDSLYPRTASRYGRSRGWAWMTHVRPFAFANRPIVRHFEKRAAAVVPFRPHGRNAAGL